MADHHPGRGHDRVHHLRAQHRVEPGRRAPAPRRSPQRSRLAVAHRWSSSSTISTIWPCWICRRSASACSASAAPSTTTSRTRRRCVQRSRTARAPAADASTQFDKWSATLGRGGAVSPRSPEVLLAISETRLRADRDAAARSSTRASASCGTTSDRLLTRRRPAVLLDRRRASPCSAMVLMAWIMFSTKRVILDPLTELTDSAHRIERGDFTAAHQTLRADEIGVLINSFAKMVQARAGARARAGAGAQRIARAGQRHRRIAPPRRGRARRPARHARDHSRRADDLQRRRQRAASQSRRHRGVRHRAAEPRAAPELLEPVQAHRQGRHANPAGAVDFGARAARRDRPGTKSSRFIIPTAASSRFSPAARRSATSSVTSPARSSRSRTSRGCAKSIA